MSFESASLKPWALVGLRAAARFTVTADASPGLLPRLLMAFAKRDLVPDGLEFHRTGESVRADIQMEAMPAEMVHLVEGNLRQVVGVTRVACAQEITGQVRRAA
jgi:hypothetical protein